MKLKFHRRFQKEKQNSLLTIFFSLSFKMNAHPIEWVAVPVVYLCSDRQMINVVGYGFPHSHLLGFPKLDGTGVHGVVAYMFIST